MRFNNTIDRSVILVVLKLFIELALEYLNSSLLLWYCHVLTHMCNNYDTYEIIKLVLMLLLGKI